MIEANAEFTVKFVSAAETNLLHQRAISAERRAPACPNQTARGILLKLVGRMRSGVKVTACLCLLLTLLSAVAVVTHQHASGESPTCSLCLAARAPAAIAAASTPNPVFLFLSTLQAEPLYAQYRLSTFALNVRPPPAS